MRRSWAWLGLETAAANPSAVNPVQWLWLETCCRCSEDQEMTFGKTQQRCVFLWRTDRRPCQQSLGAVSFPKQKLGKSCPLWCLSIMLSKHRIRSERAHSVLNGCNDWLWKDTAFSVFTSLWWKIWHVACIAETVSLLYNLQIQLSEWVGLWTYLLSSNSWFSPK